MDQIPLLGELNLYAVVVTYDRESDTLMLHFAGRGQPGVSIVADDDLYIRYDRERKRVLGLQIEGFLAGVAPRHPALLDVLDVLDVADLRGISLEEVARLRRGFGSEQRKQAAVGEVLGHFPRLLATATKAS